MGLLVDVTLCDVSRILLGLDRCFGYEIVKPNKSWIITDSDQIRRKGNPDGCVTFLRFIRGLMRLPLEWGTQWVTWGTLMSLTAMLTDRSDKSLCIQMACFSILTPTNFPITPGRESTLEAKQTFRLRTHYPLYCAYNVPSPFPYAFFHSM
jgi:hypothetical protein